MGWVGYGDWKRVREYKWRKGGGDDFERVITFIITSTAIRQFFSKLRGGIWSSVTDVFGCVTSSSVLHSVYVLIWTAPNFSSSMFNPNPK